MSPEFDKAHIFWYKKRDILKEGMIAKLDKQDKIIKCLAYNGKILVTCANTTNLVENARKIHDCSPTVTAAFGRLLTITAIMATEMKRKQDKLTIQLKGNGPIETMLTVASQQAILKGYVGNPVAEVPKNDLGKLDVSAVVGNEGYINVIKDLGLKEPYIGVSPIVSGEIAEDFANYFAKSEQRQTAVALGVLVDKNGVKASGGYLLQAMPDATDEEISKVEKAIFEAGAISKMLDKKLSLENIVKKITGDNGIKIIEDNITPLYKCDCSKEKMENSFITIGKEEIQNILKEDGKAELVCHFCNKKYEFSEQELQDLLEKIERK